MSWEYIGTRAFVSIVFLVIIVLIMFSVWGLQLKVKFLRNKPRLLFAFIFISHLFLLSIYAQSD